MARKKTPSDPTPPQPGDKAFVARIERSLSTYDPKTGKIELASEGIDEDRIVWVIWKLGSLPNLTTLDISYNSIGDAGAREIAQSLKKLTTLHIWGNSIGEAGAREIAQSLKKLTTLDIWNNSIGEAGAREIAQSLTKLTTLDIGDNSIGEAGAREIAQSLKKLTTLDIGYNSIGEAGAREIAQSLTKLTTLDIGDNSIGEAGAREIAQSLTKLTTLDIGGNSIGEAGAREIAQSLTKLTTLHIGRNSIGEAGAREIAQSLKKLTTLDIGFNSIGEASTVIGLLQSLPSLNVIYVGDNPLAFTGLVGETVKIAPEVLDITDPADLLEQLLSYAPGAATAAEAAEWDKSGVGAGGEKGDVESAVVPQEPLVRRTRKLNWLRATILGREETGKSHLFRRLLAGGELEEKPPKTADWECRVLRLENVLADHAVVSVRLFDLGGDPDLTSSHRLFLGDKRNFYVLVCNASVTRDESLMDYWLRIVRTYGTFSEDGKDRGAPAVVVLSFFDHGEHDDFVKTEAPHLADNHSVNVVLVKQYWDPKGDKRQAGANAKRQKLDPAGHAEKFAEIQRAIDECVKALNDQLGYSYADGFEEVIAAFDPESTPSPAGEGAIPLTEVEAMFSDRTGMKSDGQVGVDLLRNLGLVICPMRDRHREREEAFGRMDAARSFPLPRAPDPAYRVVKDMVFGVHWLKKVIYPVVRRTGSPLPDKRGIVARKELVHLLESLVGGRRPDELAEQVVALLTIERLIFEREGRWGAEMLIVERLEAADDRAIGRLDRDFANARRWQMKTGLILASHLPQFIGMEFHDLDAGAELHSDVFRDRVVIRWQENINVEALVKVNLNQATFEAAVEGTKDEIALERFRTQIEDRLRRVLDDRGVKLEAVAQPSVAPKTAETASDHVKGHEDPLLSLEERMIAYTHAHLEATKAQIAALFEVNPSQLSADDQYLNFQGDFEVVEAKSMSLDRVDPEGASGTGGVVTTMRGNNRDNEYFLFV